VLEQKRARKEYKQGGGGGDARGRKERAKRES